MKSNYLTSGSDYRKASYAVAKAEIDKITQERCPVCQQSIANQVAAVMCRALALNHGFGKKRLKNLIKETEWLFELCDMDGKKYKATDCIEWLRDAMGIDLERGVNEQT